MKSKIGNSKFAVGVDIETFFDSKVLYGVHKSSILNLLKVSGGRSLFPVNTSQFFIILYSTQLMNYNSKTRSGSYSTSGSSSRTKQGSFDIGSTPLCVYGSTRTDCVEGNRKMYFRHLSSLAKD